MLSPLLARKLGYGSEDRLLFWRKFVNSCTLKMKSFLRTWRSFWKSVKNHASPLHCFKFILFQSINFSQVEDFDDYESFLSPGDLEQIKNAGGKSNYYNKDTVPIYRNPNHHNRHELTYPKLPNYDEVDHSAEGKQRRPGPPPPVPPKPTLLWRWTVYWHFAKYRVDCKRFYEIYKVW